MAKSYIPQLAKRLDQLSVYVAKHQKVMRTYPLTSAQLADLATIQTIASDFGSIQYRETA